MSLGKFCPFSGAQFLYKVGIIIICNIYNTLILSINVAIMEV